jgi:ribonuclease HI
MSTADEIRALEQALARRDVAAIPGGYDAVLHPAFAEVGQSGRVWTREEMLAALAASPPDDVVELDSFAVAELAPDVWLARYDTVAAGVRVHRASIWIRSGGDLRLRYHQGTRAAGPAG